MQYFVNTFVGFNIATNVVYNPLFLIFVGVLFFKSLLGSTWIKNVESVLTSMSNRALYSTSFRMQYCKQPGNKTQCTFSKLMSCNQGF